MASRWRITGTFITTAPLHVGSGEVTTNPLLLNAKNESHCEVQAVAKDYRGSPCIPGTALKGVLRAWADRFFPKHPATDRVFGSKDVGSKDALYNIVQDLAQKGLGVIIVSDDLPELLMNCDSILVMKKGRIARVFEVPGLEESVLSQELLTEAST